MMVITGSPASGGVQVLLRSPSATHNLEVMHVIEIWRDPALGVTHKKMTDHMDAYVDSDVETSLSSASEGWPRTSSMP